MVSLQTIELEYARMPDGALLQLATELSTLTPDARLALERECLRRNLMPSLDMSPVTAASGDRLQEIATKLANDDDRSIREKWDYAIRRKYENVMDETVHFGLQVRGLKPDEASFILQQLDEYTLKRLEEAKSNRFSAFIRAICGAAIIIIGLLSLQVRVLFFIGSVLMILSIVQAAIASNRKAMYEGALENLQPIVFEEIQAEDSSPE